METGYYQMVLFEVEVAGIKMKPAPLSCHVNLHTTYSCLDNMGSLPTA